MVSARWFSSLCLTVAMLLWASSFIALKIAFRSYDPMVVIFGRMFLASLCFLFFIKKFKRMGFRMEDLKYILFMAFCEPCLYFIFEAKAIENTTAAQAGMMTAMLPLLVAVAAGFFLKEKLNRQIWFGFLLAIAGACWLSLSAESSHSAPRPALGNFYEFIAMVCATGYTVTLKRLTGRYSPFLMTAIQAFVGGLFFFPFLFLPSTQLPATIEPVSSLAIVYLGIFITIGAYGLYNFGVSRIPASQASIFVNLIPVFTVILGWLILDERFTSNQYMASALVIGGVLICQERKPRPLAVKAAIFRKASQHTNV
jgi:drug/metabolite transporter (DMT)-like permease